MTFSSQLTKPDTTIGLPMVSLEANNAPQGSHSRTSAPSQDRTARLHYDVFDIVLQFVFLYHWKDLFIVCRVSKRLYHACIPWIYRNVTIDFSDRPGLALLRRLSNVSSDLPTFVRAVTLKECNQAATTQWTLLAMALSRFTRLEDLSWDSYADLPKHVLDSIHQHHPRATIQARVTQIYLGQPADRDIGAPTFFTSSALGQLTSFDFSVRSNEFLYDDLKRDLVDLLTNAPNLKLFRIYRGPVQDDRTMYFPDMLPEFKTRLPKLRALYLTTKSIIFSRSELELWGLQGGWSELQHLVLSRATDLIPFISRVPQLTYLDIIAEQGHGMEELTEHLAPCVGTPLGAVTTLVYRHFIRSLDFSTTRHPHAIPWSILDKISATLTNYVSWHQPYVVFHPGYVTLSVDELRRFQKSYPRVTELMLDIQLRHNHWPSEILAQLASFRNLKSLMLFVHRPTSHFVHNCFSHLLHHEHQPPSDFNAELWFREGFKIIMATPANPRYEQKPLVHFKQICDFKDVEYHLNVPDWTFWMDQTGHIYSSKRDTNTGSERDLEPRKKYTKLSTEALEIKRRILPMFRNYSHLIPRNYETGSPEDDWGDIVLELTRRRKHAWLETLYGDDSVTLYDRWNSWEKTEGQVVLM